MPIMPALIIVDIEVLDPVGYEDYKSLASASIAAHGGRYLVRGGRSEVLDGHWTPQRLVVLEFDSMPKRGAPRPNMPRPRRCARAARGRT
jgi:uncharacterized protein (DUF1330 family)